MSTHKIKEFQFTSIDENHTFEGKAPIFVVREATPEDNERREELLEKLRNNYILFIKDGYKSLAISQFVGWHIYNMVYKNRYIDDNNRDDNDAYRGVIDTKSRFEWITGWRSIDKEIRDIDFSLGLVSCNLLNAYNKTRLVDSKYDSNNISANIFYELEQDQIHEKILEMNPLWLGESNRMRRSLTELAYPTKSGQSQGNFTDLATKSIYTKNRVQLASLVDEIKQDVFDNDGIIKTNILIEPLINKHRDFRHLFGHQTQHDENIFLFPESSSDYIGLLKHGQHEIRVITNRNGFTYWDTFIEDIVPTLRKAIEHYTKKLKSVRYTPDQLSAMGDMAEDTGWMNEAQDVYNDMADDGYFDDD